MYREVLTEEGCGLDTHNILPFYPLVDNHETASRDHVLREFIQSYELEAGWPV